MSGFKIVRLTEEFYPGAIEVLRQSFFPEEKVCCCVRILQDSPIVPDNTKYKSTVGSLELENLALDSARDGVSLVAIDENNQVLGVAFNKIHMKVEPGKLTYFEEFIKNRMKDPSAIGLMQFMADVDGRVDLFGKFNTDYLMEIVFLSVKSTAKGKGIGTALVKSSAQLAQELKDCNEGRNPTSDVKRLAKENRDSAALRSIPKVACAIFTSKFSQLCGQRSSYEVVLKVPYTEFKHNGKLYSEVTGPEHPFCLLDVKKLQ